MEKTKIEHMVGGKFKLGRKIGSGSFGELYIGMFDFHFFFFLKKKTFNLLIVRLMNCIVRFCTCSCPKL